MTSPYARKVDQQRLYLARTVEVIGAYKNEAPASALVQAGYLQLEMALRLYLLELQGKKNGSAKTLVNAQLIMALYEQTPMPELAELVSLTQQRTSWLATFIEQLSGLWEVEYSSKLKGSIFQVNEQSHEPDLISAQDVSRFHAPANLEDLQAALSAFSQLVERHRTGREEY